MKNNVSIIAAWAVLGLGLVIPTVLGLVTPYVLVALGALTLIAFLATGRIAQIWQEPASRTMLIAWLLLLALFAYTAQTPRDVLSAFNFTMLLLFGPLCLLLQDQRNRLPPTLPATLAFIGIVLTLLMATWFELGLTNVGNRTRAINLGPIVAANATFALAVVAGTGAFIDRRRRSLLLPVGILGGIAVSLMGASRGPLLGVAPLVLFTLVMLFIYRPEARRLVLGGFALALAGGIGALALLGSRRVSRLPQIFANLLSGNESGDHTTEIRLALYRAAWRAFNDAPVLGNGWARLMKAPTTYLDPAYLHSIKGLKHLHNDVLDFAVAGGVVGVLVYIVIVTAPLIAAWRSPADELKPARLYATGGLFIVYAFGGLTDLMFGNEYHTALFVTLNAIVLALLRPPARPASA